MHDSLMFLSPSAGLLVVLAFLPLAALLLARRRVRYARAVLCLGGGHERGWLRATALAAVPILLAVALTQPALRRHGSEAGRTDAAVFVVVDTSSSMGASAGATAPTRLTRAKRVAIDVVSGLAGIPVGVASFTDRALPNLFPTADRAVVDSTIRSLGTDSPPPRETQRVATTFGVLAALARSNFFAPAASQRAMLLLTDGESRAFAAAPLARALSAPPSVHVVVVRIGGGGDRLYAADGRPASVYRSDPDGARQAVAELVSTTGGRLSGGASSAAAALRSVLGSGPTRRTASEPETRALAPFVVLLGLIPLLYVLVGTGRTFRTPRRLL